MVIIRICLFLFCWPRDSMPAMPMSIEIAMEMLKTIFVQRFRKTARIFLSMQPNLIENGTVLIARTRIMSCFLPVNLKTG